MVGSLIDIRVLKAQRRLTNDMALKGEPARCGRLEDRFGPSWHAVLEAYEELAGHGDRGQRARVSDAESKWANSMSRD